MINTITPLFITDLEKVKKEIQDYTNEESLWKVTQGINNCGGNLALHLIGNLNHFIGAILGDTGYIRDRDAEFSKKDVPQATLIKQIEETIKMVDEVLSHLPEDQLDKTYPIEVLKRPMTTGEFILFLYGHLSYHLGQINYHRRILNN